MAEDDYDHVPLDLDSPEARGAVEEAFKLAAAARGAAIAIGNAEAWTNYELEINRVVRETLTDPLEQTVDRLAWALHGLATVAGAATYYASLASGEDTLATDLAIQRAIDAIKPGSGPSND
jgi:hypothetical protein